MSENLKSNRAVFASRLGFILAASGCAIGLGNIWRFPYVTGQYGGGFFVLLYLIFLIILATPILFMEISIGKASRRSIATSFEVLEPKGSKWHLNKYWMLSGNFFLLSFYTVVTGWVIQYLFKMGNGELQNLSSAAVSASFGEMLQDYHSMIVYTLIAISISLFVCALGLRQGVERVSKILMSFLFIFIIILAIKSMFLPNAMRGIEYFLYPSFERLKQSGIGEGVYAAMAQAFFTLGLGVGSIQIFGSYMDKSKSIIGEGKWIVLIDTMISIVAGIIIFPACLSFGVQPNSGPGLLFDTLVNIFNNMEAGRYWGIMFFFLMVLACITTLITVFENVIAIVMELFNLSRLRSICVNGMVITLASIPCILGFNEWSGFNPLGEGTNVLDLEDFILSNNILPLGALVYVLFCTSRYGWRYENFERELNYPAQRSYSKFLRFYLVRILPILIAIVCVCGYIDKFCK